VRDFKLTESDVSEIMSDDLLSILNVYLLLFFVSSSIVYV
jgi:hypothetical protein